MRRTIGHIIYRPDCLTWLLAVVRSSSSTSRTHRTIPAMLVILRSDTSTLSYFICIPASRLKSPFPIIPSRLIPLPHTSVVSLSSPEYSLWHPMTVSIVILSLPAASPLNFLSSGSSHACYLARQYAIPFCFHVPAGNLIRRSPQHILPLSLRPRLLHRHF